ncbi:hypothetical protein [Sunxiuqinia sp. sy24]|uniref:hypothetical protein n=1 Tax=Sunxiuqinia sp. sy24 TaxID=3461495 RepID=UPI00404637BF
MKTKLTFFAMALITLIFFQSCSAPKAIVKLKPETEEVKWLFGQSFMVDSLYGVIYEVGFNRIVDNQYWFDFHITNRSNMPILIDPVNFAYLAYDSLLNAQTTVPVQAMNPEDELLTIDQELAYNKSRAKNHLGISILAAGVDIATGIATLNDDNPHNDYLRTHLYDATQAGAIENAIETDNLNVLREEWASSTIRRTTLESNYSMHGKVFFKALPQARYIKLLLPVDDQQIEMNFKQIQQSSN